jgi:arginine N-succinyltransferase
MWLVRPAQPDDVNQILDIAGAQSARLSSTLPRQKEALAQKNRTLAGILRRPFAGR